MEKNYTLTIIAEEWHYGCMGGENIIDTFITTKPEWSRAEFVEWINDGKDMEDLQRIIDREPYADMRLTATVTDENGYVTYDIEMWESQAAYIALEGV